MLRMCEKFEKIQKFLSQQNPQNSTTNKSFNCHLYGENEQNWKLK